jgi:hypothetical protein
MKRTRLETLRVVSPCLEGWERMTGDDRTRHCQGCEKNVFDVSQLSRDEAERLLERTNGDVCVRLTRRPDGSIVTRVSDPVAPVVPIRLRRAGPVAVAAMGLMLGVSGAAYAQEPVENQPVADKPAVVAFSSKDEVTPTDGAFASVTGTVRRPDGNPTKAVVMLVEGATGRSFTAEVPENGRFQFINLPAGDFFLFVEGKFAFPETLRRTIAVGQTWRTEIVLNKPELITVGGANDPMGHPVSFIRESDVVCFATVESIERIDSETETFDEIPPLYSYRVKFKTGQVLKGKQVPQRLEVIRKFFQNEKLPYALHDEVLVGALKSDAGVLFNEGMGIGTVARMAASSPLSARFFRLLREKRLSRREVIEWLVERAVDKETRIEAVSELLRAMPEDETSEMTYPEGITRTKPIPDPDDPFNLAFNGPDFLTEKQKTRIAWVFFERESLLPADYGLILLVQGFGNPRFLPVFTDKLRAQMETGEVVSSGIFSLWAGDVPGERIEKIATLYHSVTEMSEAEINPPREHPEVCDPKEKEKRTVAIRERAREELRALIRAALWAYDHPETP